MKRNLEIDRLRAIGAMAVVIGHLVYVYQPNMLPFINGFAITIIDLSFIISGFVISSILVSQIDQLKGENNSLVAFFKSFLVRRIFRIYPTLWAVFFMVLFFSLFLNTTNIFSSPANVMHNSLLLLTSTFNFNFMNNQLSLALAPCWSLAIEEQFYLTFPIFLLFTKNNGQRAKLLIFMIALITFVLRPLTFKYYPSTALYFTQTHADALMYGCLIYILSVQPWFDQLKPADHGNRWLRLIFITVIFYIIIGVTTLGNSPVFFLPINGIVCSLLIICAVFERNIIVFPAIIQKILDLTGPRSYTLYLVHLPMILLANEFFERYGVFTTGNLVSKIIIELLLIFAANELLYRHVLIPFLEKGKNISSTIINASDQTTSQDNEVSPGLRIQYAATDNAT